jgi:hypothetical protein
MVFARLRVRAYIIASIAIKFTRITFFVPKSANSHISLASVESRGSAVCVEI